jgi:elongation of very long chain fatty acids protein 7
VHHGIMPFTAWWSIKFVGGGHTTFCGFLNMGIHVVMYFYYLMSAMGPSVQKYLWWKRYLTRMQLGQFIAFFVHATFPFFIPCDFPKMFAYVILFHGAMFFLFFANFYVQNYTNKKPNKTKKADLDGNGELKQE